MAKSFVKLRIEGLPQLNRKLRRLTDKEYVGKRIMKSGLQAGGKVVVARARTLARKRTGLMRRAIGSEARHNKRGWYVVIAPRADSKHWRHTGRGKTGFAMPHKYSHLVEGGTRPHRITIRVGGKDSTRRLTIQHPGAKAQPFLRPALAQAGSRAGRVATDKIAKGITKLAMKGGTK